MCRTLIEILIRKTLELQDFRTFIIRIKYDYDALDVNIIYFILDIYKPIMHILSVSANTVEGKHKLS